MQIEHRANLRGAVGTLKVPSERLPGAEEVGRSSALETGWLTPRAPLSNQNPNKARKGPRASASVLTVGRSGCPGRPGGHLESRVAGGHQIRAPRAAF